MLHVELSAEVVEGEEGVGEHQVLGAHGNGDERGELRGPAHICDSGDPGNPTPCCALLVGIPSWRPQGAGLVVAAAVHQCRACRGPRPAEPHPRSPAVRTGNKEESETDSQLGGHGEGGRRLAKLVQPDVQPYPAWGGDGHACWAGSVSSFSPSPLSPSPGQMGAVTYHLSPHHIHSRSLEWGQSKHLVEWDKQVGRGGVKQVKPVPDQAPPSDRWGWPSPTPGTACSWSTAAPPLGLTSRGAEKLKDRARHLDSRGSMSFDPDPIDRSALSCLLTKGAGSCPAPPPSSIPAGEQV